MGLELFLADEPVNVYLRILRAETKSLALQASDIIAPCFQPMRDFYKVIPSVFTHKHAHTLQTCSKLFELALR